MRILLLGQQRVYFRIEVTVTAWGTPSLFYLVCWAAWRNADSSPRSKITLMRDSSALMPINLNFFSLVLAARTAAALLPTAPDYAISIRSEDAHDF